MSIRWRIAQFFEIRWWKRYLQGRDKSEYLNWKRNYWRGFLGKSGICLAANSSALDAGCGPAGIFLVLDNQQVDAIDPLLDEYEKTLPHFSKTEHPNVFFYASTLENFSPGKKYDTVFCLNAVNHVADLDACFDKLFELTKPGGTLAVSIDAHNFQFLKHLFRLFPGDVLHPHQFDLAEYQAMQVSRGGILERTILVKKELIFNYYLLVCHVE